MNVLFIGDIVGAPGREAIKRIVPQLRVELALDFVIANAENASGGSGITAKVAEELFDAEVDVLTSGDHIWKKQEIFELINKQTRILRPINYPVGAPGNGFGVFTASNGEKIGVINVNGRVFMDPIECPFKTTKQAVDEIRTQTPIIFVDIHAEATSEKVALGWFLDGTVSGVCGTHTHIQTADEKILPKGTGYITDLGMTGPYDSVIGRKVEDVLHRFLTGLPTRFEVANDNVWLSGVVVSVDDATGITRSINRVQRKLLL